MVLSCYKDKPEDAVIDTSTHHGDTQTQGGSNPIIQSNQFRAISDERTVKFYESKETRLIYKEMHTVCGRMSAGKEKKKERDRQQGQ